MFVASLCRINKNSLKRTFITGKRIPRAEITPMKIGEFSTGNRTNNYNFEEHPKFTKKVTQAKEQRNLIEELEKNPVVPRRQRRIFDKPKYDTDITE